METEDIANWCRDNGFTPVPHSEAAAGAPRDRRPQATPGASNPRRFPHNELSIELARVLCLPETFAVSSTTGPVSAILHCMFCGQPHIASAAEQEACGKRLEVCAASGQGIAR
jgi:hypothetical protein